MDILEFFKIRLRYFTAKYRVKEVADKFGNVKYVAQVRRNMFYWETIRIDSFGHDNCCRIELKWCGQDNVNTTYDYAKAVIDNYIIGINTLVKPKTTIKYV